MKNKLVTLFVLLASIGLLQADCKNCNTCCNSKPKKVQEVKVVEKKVQPWLLWL